MEHWFDLLFKYYNGNTFHITYIISYVVMIYNYNYDKYDKILYDKYYILSYVIFYTFLYIIRFSDFSTFKFIINYILYYLSININEIINKLS